MLLLTENCLQWQKWSPYKSQGVVSTPVCAKKERNGPASADQRPAKTAAMCTACPDYAHPPYPIPPFLVTQNLSSKWIVPTDNMRPELHDEYTCHQVKLKTWEILSMRVYPCALDEPVYMDVMSRPSASFKLCVGLLLMPMYSTLPTN